MEIINQKHSFKLTRCYTLLLFIGFSLFCLFSCNEHNKNESDESINKSDESIEDLKLELDSLQSIMSGLVEGWLKLETKISLIESKAMAFFCASNGINDGFQKIENSAGSFFISLTDITPYLSGYKLVFSIGNPSLATYHNTKLKVSWNRSFGNAINDKKDYVKEHKNWLEEKKEKVFALQSSLNPGEWTSVVVHVTPATLEQLYSIEVSIETATVSLIKAQGIKS